MSSPSELEASPTSIRGKDEPQLDTAAVTIAHCSADSSSTDTMSRRQQVVQAVRRPVRNGSRHCINVLKKLLPQEVLHEIHDQVASGVKPLQAVEAVTQQRMGPQVAADVTKLLMVVSLASSAGGGVVQATKALLCLLAAPLYLGRPMRVLTSVLLPTPVAGGLLGCCLVAHTTREILAADTQQQQHKSQSAGSAAEGCADSSSGSLKRRERPWWAFWKLSSRQRVEQQTAAEALEEPDSTAVQQQQQQQQEKEAVRHTSNAVAGTASADAAAEGGRQEASSPAGPAGPDLQTVTGSKDTAPVGSTSAAAAAANEGVVAHVLDHDDAAATAAAVEAAAAESSALVNHPAVSPEAYPLPATSLLSYDSIDSYEAGDGTVTAAVTTSVTNNGSDDAAGATSMRKQQQQQQPSPLPLSPTNSLRAALNGLHTPSPAAAAAAAAAAAYNPAAAQYQMQLRRRSSSGLGDFTGEPLSPTSSGAYSPREEIEESAAEVQRRWSLGHHSDMIPDPKSFKMVQDQPYRPPVFTRLSTGYGGCRITAAAAAAAAREQHAAAQQQRRLAQGVGDGDIRRYHSLDINRVGSPDTAAAAAVAPAGADGWAGDSGVPSALLPPLPGVHSHKGELGQQQQQLAREEGSGELPVLGGGVVRQRSLDWGHRLCKTDSM